MTLLNAHKIMNLLPQVQAGIYEKISINNAIIHIVELSFEDINLTPAEWCPPHTHKWYEFTYVLDGVMQSGFGDGPMLEVGANEFFFIPPGMEHSHRYSTNRPHQSLNLRWTFEAEGSTLEAGGMFQKLATLNNWKPGIYKDQYGLEELWGLIFEETARGSHSYSLQLTMVKLLLTLTDIHQPNETWIETEHHSDAAVLRKVEVYLSNSQVLRIDVHELAASLHMSYGHLARLYKRLTGSTITDRWIKIRLERSQDLLRETNSPINAIAEKTGFKSPYAYSHAFKHFFGITPTQYRRKT